MNAEASCIVTACTQASLGVCAQCGRTYCAQHGGWQAGYGERCRDCYALLLEGLVKAHSRAGKLAQATQVLENASQAAQTPEGCYYLGLAQAAAGELDAALTSLDGLLNGESSDPMATLARQAAAIILSARAVQRLETENILGAVDDLRRAVDLAPGNAPERGELLACLAYRSAFEYFKAGRLPEALREWEAVQQRDPGDLRVTHYLAILYFRLASALEGQQSNEADRYWKLAIAHWVVVLINPQFWEGWAAQRSQAVGEISAQALAEVADTTIKRLQTGFREYRAHYLESGQTQFAERQAEYDVVFTHERHAARTMLHVLQRDGRQFGKQGFVCGPLMLEHLHSLPGGVHMADELGRLAQSSYDLRNYYSPLGRYYVMVKELNRYQEAKTGLEGWLITNPSDEEAQALLVDCLIELGKEQIDARHPKSALDLLEQADKYRLRQPELRALISKAAVVQTTDILQEENTLYKKEGDSQDKQILRNAANLLEAAIQLLERVKKTYYVSDADFTAQLAEAYFRRGLIRHRLTENQGCLDDLERTLKINPNHAAANENYVTALMNRAFDHLNGNNPEKALELLKQAIDRDPVKVDRQQAGQILFGLGIKHANEAINAINYGIGWGRQPLINALAEIDQAIELDPGNQHYRTERAKVYQIMIQRPY